MHVPCTYVEKSERSYAFKNSSVSQRSRVRIPLEEEKLFLTILFGILSR